MKIWHLSFFKQKIDSCEIKSLFRFQSYLKVFKAVLKNNHGRTHRKENEKAVLTTVACFKVSTPVRSQRQ